MIVLKGDKVLTVSGDEGEVLDLWGRACWFISFKSDLDGKITPMFETDVAKILQRKNQKNKGRGER